jgi:CII-binding regulator of phage lambda lysogenization HflD
MAFVKPRESIELPTPTAVEAKTNEQVRETAQGAQAESEAVADSIGSLLNRVAGSSVHEINRVIAELQTLRDLLHEEGGRTQREIAKYALLSQSAMQTTNLIAENLAKFKRETGATSAIGDDKARPFGPWGEDRCRAITGLRPQGAL